MKRISVEVSTSLVSDPSKPNVTTKFEHDFPESLEEARAKFPPRTEGEESIDPVFELFKNAYTIALQSPARKELVAQWESVDADERAALIKAPEKADGQHTAVLPSDQQAMLQSRMDSWVLGEKAPRTRVVHVVGDPVKAFLEALPTMSDERRAEIQAQVAALLGVSVGTAPTGRPSRH